MSDRAKKIINILEDRFGWSCSDNTDVRVICSNCGIRCTQSAKYCSSCGTMLTEGDVIEESVIQVEIALREVIDVEAQ